MLVQSFRGAWTDVLGVLDKVTGKSKTQAQSNAINDDDDDESYSNDFDDDERTNGPYNADCVDQNGISALALASYCGWEATVEVSTGTFKCGYGGQFGNPDSVLVILFL